MRYAVPASASCLPRPRRNPAIHWYFALMMGFLLGEPASALTTTYTWENLPIGSQCIDDPYILAEFPELCIDETTGLLSIAFEHDQPIWDNDAHGCDPYTSNRGCGFSEFDRILRITLSGIAIFEELEILSFEHIDFLGQCPAQTCEEAPPIIGYHAIDALTGFEIRGGGDGALSYLFLFFPDGRVFITGYQCCSRRTVPAPGGIVLFAFGLAGLSWVTRRKAHQRTNAGSEMSRHPVCIESRRQAADSRSPATFP